MQCAPMNPDPPVTSTNSPATSASSRVRVGGVLAGEECARERVAATPTALSASPRSVARAAQLAGTNSVSWFRPAGLVLVEAFVFGR